VPSDVDPPTDPDAFVAQLMIDEAQQCRGPRRTRRLERVASCGGDPLAERDAVGSEGVKIDPLARRRARSCERGCDDPFLVGPGHGAQRMAEALGASPPTVPGSSATRLPTASLTGESPSSTARDASRARSRRSSADHARRVTPLPSDDRDEAASARRLRSWVSAMVARKALQRFPEQGLVDALVRLEEPLIGAESSKLGDVHDLVARAEA
jgi:hypothetical protein